MYTQYGTQCTAAPWTMTALK